MTRQPVYRVRFRFSADGRRAACLAADDRGEVALEGWILTGNGPRRWLRLPVTCDPEHSCALPVAGDRLLCSAWRGGRHQLMLVGPAGVLAVRPAPELRITAAPPGHGLALGIAPGPDGDTEVFRIAPEPAGTGTGWWSPVARTPAVLRDPGLVVGDRVVFAARTGPAVRPVVFDPASGAVTPLGLPATVARAVPVAGAGGRVLLGLVDQGRHWLATAALGEPGPGRAGVEPLAGLAHLADAVRPLALDPTGTEVVVRVRDGVRSRLLRHWLTTEQTDQISAPPGTAAAPAAWTRTGLWLPFATPTAPAEPWWLPSGSRRLRRYPAAGPPPGRPGRVESLPGAAGPVEAVVLGDWRTSDRVVLALHGGPAERWALGFDPGLQGLAAAGLAVVAPNQRGSTGYGRDHQEAIKGAWGGPDLDDVVAIGTYLRRVRGAHRARPALYGDSYGAFLGLLALARSPDLWSACVAMAPFLSGARLYADATDRVRAMIDRLDGTAPVVDATGPRDLLALAPRMRGQVLVLHGAGDPTIPVSHSRALVATLATVPAVTVTYRELAGRGHEAVKPSFDTPEFVEVTQFLGGACPHPTGCEPDPERR